MSQQFGHNSNRARLSQAQAGTSGLQPLGQQGQVGPAGVGASIQPQGGSQLTSATGGRLMRLQPRAALETQRTAAQRTAQRTPTLREEECRR